VGLDLGGRGAWYGRPTLAAGAQIEAAFGPLPEIAARLSVEPGFGETVAIVCACIEARGEQVDEDLIAEALLDVGLETGFTAARLLIESYFKADSKHAKPDKQSSSAKSDGRFPWRDYVGSAIAVWGLSPEEAWGLTVGEWWAACDAYIAANGGGEKNESKYTPEDTRDIIADLRREKALQAQRDAARKGAG
jgi:hypothetical protein